MTSSEHRCALGLPLLLALVLLPAPGCVSSDAYLTAAAPAGAEIGSVLLLPMNFDATPPNSLKRGTAIVGNQVSAYLESTGRKVLRVPLREALILWARIAAEQRKSPEAAAGGGETELTSEAIQAARSELARRLCKIHPADVVAMPTLMIREGWFSGMSLRWDGVTRSVPLRRDSGTTMMPHSINGKGTGTSLRMTLYTPDGEKIFERHAGLEPTLRWTMQGFGSARGASVRGYPRNDLFRDAAIIEDGVALSLMPLIRSPGEPSE